MCLFKNVDSSHINSIRVRRLSPTHQERRTMAKNKDTPRPTIDDNIIKIAINHNAVYQEQGEFDNSSLYENLK